MHEMWNHLMHKQQRIISSAFLGFFDAVQLGMQQSAAGAMMVC
jgi:hypothetical protein